MVWIHQDNRMCIARNDWRGRADSKPTDDERLSLQKGSKGPFVVNGDLGASKDLEQTWSGPEFSPSNLGQKQPIVDYAIDGR